MNPDQKMIILQCWDDGVTDDTRLTELLKSKGAKASFNLNLGLNLKERSYSFCYKEKKDVYRLARSELLQTYEGFTIANHCYEHPWALKISHEEWEQQVIDGRKALQDLFQQPILGFAYPYGQSDKRTAEVVAKAGHTYARSCENATPCTPTPNAFSQATDCHFHAPDFWERYQKAKETGSRVFYFWGHSYEFLSEEHWSSFSKTLDRINNDPETVWGDLPESLALANKVQS
ncbi:polysaccharide deacetylase family protein [Pelagicoccus albus]|uniref:Polysaccharide deacetylase family protein n=1 Tax=Pelagicoccus albus TaxID=415222 RepID=A0A7X1E8S3_9BACT|nr:polysaccharide deacetylase family protein [Pelagicoccus albus]MBC2607070.1 polysaccharide deacetylase family protein [Pelagicoccus albus]